MNKQTSTVLFIGLLLILAGIVWASVDSDTASAQSYESPPSRMRRPSGGVSQPGETSRMRRPSRRAQHHLRWPQKRQGSRIDAP
jgi:hypothetical protein